MVKNGYLMEGPQEAIRLDVKTDGAAVERQARWAGLQPGMRVADLGCGAGKTTYHLNKVAQPGGQAVGVDIAEQRVEYARTHYGDTDVEFVVGDIRQSLADLGEFDFVWIRFVLEYYLAQSPDIVKNVAANLKPGGILCLIDLDCNCLRYHGLPGRLDRCIKAIMTSLEANQNFDPYVGVKLYSFLYDLKFEDIAVDVTPHNLIFSDFKEAEVFNWTKKAETAGKSAGLEFEEYPGGFDEFMEEVKRYFSDPRVFTYTPLIACRGVKPGL
jgi:ubiquinone/menaquinone biosynthesis C-methylase UbiE